MKNKTMINQSKAKEAADLKKLKNKYNELEDKYKLIFELMDRVPDVIYFKDTKGRLIMVNQAHAKGLGLKPEEVVGKTDFDIFPKDRAEKMGEDDNYVITTGKPIIDKIERATRADGVDNYASTTKIPRYDNKGRVIGLIGITRDITQRIQFEHLREEKASISKKLEVLEELNKMKSEFISIVSHELRTPLAIIKDVIMLLIDGIAGPVANKQKELLIKGKDNIARLDHIIEELLDISRIASGKIKMHYSLINLNDLLMDSSSFFKKLAQENGIDLEYKLPRSQINIFIDAGRINQVATNLINNAIKFTEQNGKIRVEVNIFEAKVRVGVIDTGTGIAKQDLPKIFNKFVQLTNEFQAERKGIGLGLSIAKELVEKNGGEIWVESELGVGSKFYFTLPRFYTGRVLSKDIRDKINNLLEKNIPVHLINLLVLNYKEFKKRLNIKPRKLFEDLKEITDGAYKKVCCFGKKEPQIALQDYAGGEFGILLPEANKEEAARFCNLVNDKIKKHFAKNKLENVFINLGGLSYPSEFHPITTKQLPGNVNIKKICIGSEIRHFPRISYKVDIDILLSANQIESSQSIDISEGGVCLVAERNIETDARVLIRLKFFKGDEPLSVMARVAWIKAIERVPEISVHKYRLGLEFINLKNRDKENISKFIKSISHKIR
ncbi:MAG: ATP-binding protein [Candidatus Omnitrophota bacterium]|nr:ATP-binding protein [Candidatus Omnitrophota bacterium]